MHLYRARSDYTLDRGKVGEIVANAEHVDRLKGGVSVWNAWRASNPGVVPDLSDFDFRSGEAIGSQIYGRHKGERPGGERLLLQRIDLSKANLRNAKLIGADMTGANLTYADLAYSDLSRATLSGAKLRDATVYGATLTEATLTDVDAVGADFRATRLAAADLSRSDLSRVDFTFADVKSVKLAGATFDVRHLLRHVGGVRNSEEVNGPGEFIALFGSRQAFARADRNAGDSGLEAVTEDDLPQPSKMDDLHRIQKPLWKVEHLNKLKEGPEAWNMWRKQNPNVTPTFQGMDFVARLRDEPKIFRFPYEDADQECVVLEGYDFEGTNFRKCKMKGVRLLDCNLNDADFVEAELSGASILLCDLMFANFSEAHLGGAALGAKRAEGSWFQLTQMPDVVTYGSFSECAFSGANLRNADLSQTPLMRSDFRRAKLEGADLTASNCEGADFTQANLSGAFLVDAELTGCVLTNANLSGANVAGVRVQPSTLQGMCDGVGGIADMYGSPEFQDQLRAQSYVDTLRAGLTRRYNQVRLPAFLERRYNKLSLLYRGSRGNAQRPRRGGKSPGIGVLQLLEMSLLRAARQAARGVAAVVGGFATMAPIFGAITGTIVGLVLMQGLPASDGSTGWWSNFFGFLQSPAAHQVAGSVLFFVTLFGFLGSWIGQSLGLFLWSLFDYGRDWDRVVALAAVLIGVIGTFYYNLSPEHVVFDGHSVARDFWLYPWYVAALGFATLGIAEMVTPVTGLGMLLVIINVLAGWVTLGLLISVIGDAFKQRG